MFEPFAEVTRQIIQRLRSSLEADDFSECTMVKVFEAAEGFAFGENALLYNVGGLKKNEEACCQGATFCDHHCQ